MNGSTQKKPISRGLGKGLNILIPNAAADIPGESVQTLGINEIEPNREQPRKSFDEQTLNELADSISEHGIIQPLIIRKSDGYYEIIAGERRWRAARIAGLSEVPVIIRDCDEQNSLVLALIENIQRENLNGIEEAFAYKRLQEEFDLTQDAIAERVGKKRSTVANSLRLLKLPEDVIQLLCEGSISVGHAKVLLSIDDSKIQSNVAKKIVEHDLSVRQTEEIVRDAENKRPKPEPSKLSERKSLIYKNIENELSILLGTRVKLSPGKSKSKIEIDFFSNDDLDRLFELFKKLED